MNLIEKVRFSLAPYHLKKAEIELHNLRRSIIELHDWCSADSPEIGHAARWLIGFKDSRYYGRIDSFREALRRGELTFDALRKTSSSSNSHSNDGGNNPNVQF